jgi:hypothetical protein
MLSRVCFMDAFSDITGLARNLARACVTHYALTASQ